MHSPIVLCTGSGRVADRVGNADTGRMSRSNCYGDLVGGMFVVGFVSLTNGRLRCGGKLVSRVFSQTGKEVVNEIVRLVFECP